MAKYEIDEAYLVRNSALIGTRFTRLTVVAYEGKYKGNNYFRCMCDCGTEKILQIAALKSGGTRSCRCLARELTIARSRTHGCARNIITGKCSREYKIWDGMVQRCENPKAKGYKDYGGRGIKVHPSIRRFEDFYAYMGPSNGLTIERKNVNGDYEPGNIEWIPSAHQGRNRRNNVRVVYREKLVLITHAFKALGTSPEIYYRLLYQGMSSQDAFEAATP